MTDPIADMLTRIRNAIIADIDSVEVPASRIKLELARILTEEGYLSGFEAVERGKFKFLTMRLKRTDDGGFALSELRRVSKPGRRVYVNRSEIPRVRGGMGVAILSTSHGIMTGLSARKRGIGGELLATVW